jgi:Ca2+-binding RTX toxin-like protein
VVQEVSAIATAGSGTQLVRGTSAAETLNGGAGPDILKGGAGTDAIVFDASDFLMDGGAGIDRLLAQDNIDLTKVDDDKLRNLEVIDLGASNASYSTQFTAADVKALNLDGEITVTGGAGDSARLVGAWTQQADSIVGSDTYQVFTLDNATVKVLVPVGVTYVGTDGRDFLTAGQGGQSLEGGLGSDVLNGGAGTDTLVGGRGEDVFIYDAADASYNGGDAGVGGLDNETDTVQLNGSGLTVDLTTGPRPTLIGIEVWNITGSGDNTLVVGADQVRDRLESTKS